MSGGWSVEEIAARVADAIPDRSYVNLGIGLPELVAGCVPPERDILYHTENGLLGMTNLTEPNSADPDLINAGKKPVSLLAGSSFFHHADSFAMIRGGHIDVCVLGALQVSQDGDLANWSTGEADAVPSVGGAMDLVAGVPTIFVLTKHCAKDGSPKLVERCTYPLTGMGVVTRVFTDLAVVDICDRGFVVIELAPGISLDHVRAHTGAPITSSAAMLSDHRVSVQ
jgi:3-oxoadipate CoA-transferase, beta subunit